MLRSMFAGVSGLRGHQQMMDVVGNNISNVNTTGYKSTRATFQDALYQTQRGAVAGVDADDGGPDGGMNPLQIGLGSRLASVDQNFSQGSFQTTGRATDVAIDGEGFFVLEDNQYTRAGTFNWDSEGHLVAPGGQIVQGISNDSIEYDGDEITGDFGEELDADVDEFTDLEAVQVAPDVLERLRDVSIGADGYVSGRTEDGEEVNLARIALADFVNPNGLERSGESIFVPSAASGEAAINNPGAEGLGGLEGGVLEMSNVDLAEEFTNLIMSQRGFQANARTITTSDELLQELVNIKR